MARSISVKIPTYLLVEQLEARLAEINKDIEEYPVKREQYEKDMAQYEKDVVQFIIDYVYNNTNQIGNEYDSIIRIGTSYSNRVELTLNPVAIPGFPEKPEAPSQPNPREHFGRDYTTRKELLEKNLKILKMTSQEEVSASTYGAVMEIL